MQGSWGIVARVETEVQNGRPTNRGSIVDSDKRLISSSKRPDRLWGLPSLLCNWQRRLFFGGKRQVREADHPPQSRAVWRKTCIAYE